MENVFTPKIMEILTTEFGDLAQDVFEASWLIQYLNFKTQSVNRGSKHRAAYANHYSLYVLLEDYVDRGFVGSGEYKDYVGARFTDLLARVKQLPFGNKLQNHALNSRMNDEFAKFFPAVALKPIIRDLETKRYWINEGLIIVTPAGGKSANIASVWSSVELVDK